MHIIDSLINRFASYPGTGDELGIKINNLTDHLDCLHRAHANHPRQMELFRMEVLERINTPIEEQK